MSAVNSKWVKWYQVAGIGLICGLVVTGCDRKDQEDKAELTEATEQPADNTIVAPAIDCDNPMVQDRLKAAIKNTINQQAQSVARGYADETGVRLSSASVSSKVNGILIDVQNAAILQEPNSNGLTTCQASISMTLPSEDLYQASQVQAGNNQPSLQTRLAQQNIRMNNNMLVDDAFTYVVGTQGGQVRASIAGQPALINIVSDVMAGSVFKSAMDDARAQRASEEAARRRQVQAAQDSNDSQSTRQPRTITPVEPIRPAEPATPPTINQDNITNPVQNNNQAAVTPVTPKPVPKDESIDMVIIEDESATY